MTILRDYQISIMLFLAGICFVLSVMTLFTESITKRRKAALALMEFSGTLLLVFDILSYRFRGTPGMTGFIMVRVSNGMVFFFELFIPYLVTQYLKDLFREEDNGGAIPVFLKFCDVFFVIGTAMLVVNQFTGMYYTFDEQNIYHRSASSALSYVAPVLIVILQELTLLFRGKKLSKGIKYSLIMSIAHPTIFSIVQIFCYGVSLTNMAMVAVIIAFHMVALHDLNKTLEKARRQEIEFHIQEERKEAAMFMQTAEALSNAIDAKDRYTHGHSARVAKVSRMIAEEAGYPDRYCSKVYFSALLHDVGKIGVRHAIINKPAGLDREEIEHIRQHTVIGGRILSGIKQSPFLAIGARSHHERYDGTGYPDGLCGENIPEIARIIAVADAFDAMTSTRSYRSKLPMSKARDGLEKGKGTQFDPRFADILIGIIDSAPEKLIPETEEIEEFA